MSADDDLGLRPAVELAAAMCARRIGSRELLEHYLARIERLNPALGAVVTLDVERARQAADAADGAVARGEHLGPLHGLPMTVKDSFETAGVRTTCGAPSLAEHVPAADAIAVARLRAAGAVIFGKTNTPTFAMDLQTYNPLFGTTNNPWDHARTPGGSSGGAAAAVAAGLTALELGSDIGGSIRTPAAFCGVYGHKPTWGIVPIRGHIPGPPGTLAEFDIGVAGPLTRSADDLDLMLGLIAAPDPERAVAWRLTLPPPRRTALREFRVAAWLDERALPVDAAVRTRLEAAVEALRRAGATVDERARPGFALADAFRDYQRLLFPITTSGLPDGEYARLCEAAALGDDTIPTRFARAATMRHREWLRTHEARERYRAGWAQLFRDFDVLICPAAPVAAFAHDQEGEFLSRTIRVNGETRSYVELLAWAGLVGMALLPATVAPAGRTADGLPVGVQIVGPYLEDRTPIEFARLLAEVVGGYVPPPTR